VIGDWLYIKEGKMSEDYEFSVCQFFTGGEYEYVRRWVNAEEAMKAFYHYTNNVAVKMGVIERVIVTDGGDCTNAEWKKGLGYTYPPELVELQRQGRTPNAAKI
jgi:hypothetical protein